MVQLTIPQNLLSAIETYNELASTRPEDRVLENAVSIDHHVVHRISSDLLTRNANGGSDGCPGTEEFRLSSLLKGCSIYILPKPPKLEPTPEFRALMARLRTEAEAKEYATLTNKLHAEVEYEDDEEYTYEDLKRHMSIIANILISTVATSAAVWMVASSWEAPQRLALAFTCSLVVCIAEVVIFGGYIRRIDESKQQEKKRAKNEKKVVVNTWELGAIKEKQGSSGIRKRKG